jgi:hypothetical protein
MASLKTVERFLQINTTNKYLSPGRKDPEKIQYYRYPEYFSMTDDKWFIIDNRRYSEDILSNHIFYSAKCGNSHGYSRTNIRSDGKCTTKYFHQILINYNEGKRIVKYFISINSGETMPYDWQKNSAKSG